MSDYLNIAVTFLDARFHGRADGGEPEWPPSPLRLLQAIVAANAEQIGADGDLHRALTWLEAQPPPMIFAPTSKRAESYCLSVPNNAMDIVGQAWMLENYFGDGDANPAKHRTMKTFRPVLMIDGETVYYLWKLDDAAPFRSLINAARRVVALGWGIDLVVACAQPISSEQLRSIPGERWIPTTSMNVTSLRTPIQGTLIALQQRHRSFLSRIRHSVFSPVQPLNRFAIAGYRRSCDPITHPFAVFELRNDDGSFCMYPQRKLMHIAGMVRHLAMAAMKQSPPADAPDNWVERYVAGHCNEEDDKHRQFSYLPVPSIGNEHADQAVRRVMIAAPMGDETWLEHLAQRLRGKVLVPKYGNEFQGLEPPALVRVYHDKVARCYTDPATRWTSVTPVILPGHDDRKPAKTRKLIEVALNQSGIDQPCEFEWSANSMFRKSLSAHKYDKDGNPVGYLRPDHLLTQTAIHLTLQFNENLCVPGPLAIGAGRHCGFGLMAKH
jgi:CRISPR-associated protein Csb2